MSIADWTNEEWDALGSIASAMGLPWDPVDGVVFVTAPGSAMEMLERFRDHVRAEWEAELDEQVVDDDDIVVVLGGFFEATESGITKEAESLAAVADALLAEFKITRRDK